MNFRLMGAILKISLRGGKLVLSALTSPSRWFHRENVLSERSFLLFLFPSCSFFFFALSLVPVFVFREQVIACSNLGGKEIRKCIFVLIRCLLVSNVIIVRFEASIIVYLTILNIYLLYNKVVKYNICK